MTPVAEHDYGVDLFELSSAIWQRKWVVIGVAIAFITAGAGYAFWAPATYRAEVLLAPAESRSGQSMPTGLGGLANLAGIDLSTSNDSTESVATLRSRAFIEEFIIENDLLPILYPDKWDKERKQWLQDSPPNIHEAVDEFIEDVRSVEEDTRTGLITVAVVWFDPQVSAQWVAELVDRINERMRTRDLMNSERKLEYLESELEKASLVELRQAIARLIENEMQTTMLARAEREYAFKIVDPARAPYKHNSPKRALILVLSALAGTLIGMFVAISLWVNTGRHGPTTTP